VGLSAGSISHSPVADVVNTQSEFDRADIYDAFGDSSSKTNQEHLDTICALAANIAEAQTYYPVVSAVDSSWETGFGNQHREERTGLNSHRSLASSRWGLRPTASTTNHVGVW
jgi:hypothetical protein